MIKHALLLACLAAVPTLAQAEFTRTIWAVQADDGHSTWNDTVLTILCERDGADGAVQIEGYFDWQSDRGSFGREFFSGSISSDNSFELRGFSLEASNNIITATYLGHMTQTRDAFDGRWLEGLPGVFTATLTDQTAPAQRFEQLPCTWQNSLS